MLSVLLLLFSIQSFAASAPGPQDIGVEVKFSPRGGCESMVEKLQEAGVNIRTHTRFKIEHNKFGIYDQKVVSTGSFNWTNPAEERNSENCLRIENAKIANQYLVRFETLWPEQQR